MTRPIENGPAGRNVGAGKAAAARSTDGKSSVTHSIGIRNTRERGQTETREEMLAQKKTITQKGIGASSSTGITSEVTSGQREKLFL